MNGEIPAKSFVSFEKAAGKRPSETVERRNSVLREQSACRERQLGNPSPARNETAYGASTGQR